MEKEVLTPNKKSHNIIIIVMALIIIAILFGGGYGYVELRKRIKKEIDQKEKQIEDSKRKQDSILDLIDYWKSDADYSRKQTDILYNKNRQLYDKLKKKELDIRLRDTNFLNNARIITNSINRYYHISDSIR